METILDIKNALKDIPEELLDSLWFGSGEGYEGEIGMVASEGSELYEFPQIFEEINKNYPELNKFNQLIRNVAKAQSILSGGDENESADIDEKLQQEGVTDVFFDKKE